MNMRDQAYSEAEEYVKELLEKGLKPVLIEYEYGFEVTGKYKDLSQQFLIKPIPTREEAFKQAREYVQKLNADSIELTEDKELSKFVVLSYSNNIEEAVMTGNISTHLVNFRYTEKE